MNDIMLNKFSKIDMPANQYFLIKRIEVIKDLHAKQKATLTFLLPNGIIGYDGIWTHAAHALGKWRA